MVIFKKISFWTVIVLSVIGYLLFSYSFARVDTIPMFVTYTILFSAAIYLTVYYRKSGRKLPWYYLFAVGLVFRLCLLFTPPHLSDDYFRFNWDGNLQAECISAFAFLPSEYQKQFVNDPQKLSQFKKLYNSHSEEFPEGMNSKNYYSIYPAINQFVFYVSNLFGNSNNVNLILMKLFLFLGEIVTFLLLRKLLIAKSMSTDLTALYWLNPLIIIEIVGNLHFEGLAITFLLLALHYLNKRRTGWAGFALALAINTKLNPIFLIGAVFRKINVKQFIVFCSVSVIVTAVLLFTVIQPMYFQNFVKSFGLYFAWFNFNAGPYYVVREFGKLFFELDLSSKISIVFPILTILLISWISIFSKKDIAGRLLLIYVVYFLFTPILHPWYITILVPFAVLSKKIYPLVWSFFIFFTYIAYAETFKENLIVVWIEFAIVLLTMYSEYKKLKWVESLKRWVY